MLEYNLFTYKWVALGLVSGVSCDLGHLPSDAQVKSISRLMNRKLQESRLFSSQSSSNQLMNCPFQLKRHFCLESLSFLVTGKFTDKFLVPSLLFFLLPPRHHPVFVAGALIHVGYKNVSLLEISSLQQVFPQSWTWPMMPMDQMRPNNCFYKQSYVRTHPYLFITVLLWLISAIYAELSSCSRNLIACEA